MKTKLISTIALAGVLAVGAASAEAHGYYGHGGYYRHGGGWGWGGWVAPAVVGGVIGYELSRPPVYVQPAPVVVQQPPVIMQQPTMMAPSTVVIDGVVYTKQMMIINGVQQEVLVRQ